MNSTLHLANIYLWLLFTFSFCQKDRTTPSILYIFDMKKDLSIFTCRTRMDTGVYLTLVDSPFLAGEVSYIWYTKRNCINHCSWISEGCRGMGRVWFQNLNFYMTIYFLWSLKGIKTLLFSQMVLHDFCGQGSALFGFEFFGGNILSALAL